MYKRGTEHGIVNSAYSRNPIESCQEQLLNLEPAPAQEVAGRTANSKK